jgi:hypothetical protein
MNELIAVEKIAQRATRLKALVLDSRLIVDCRLRTGSGNLSYRISRPRGSTGAARQPSVRPYEPCWRIELD